MFPPFFFSCTPTSYPCTPTSYFSWACSLILSAPLSLLTPTLTCVFTHILGLLHTLLAAPPPLMNTPHLLHVPPTNYSCTFISCFSLSSFLVKLFLFIYFYFVLLLFYYYLFIFIFLQNQIFENYKKLQYIKINKKFSFIFIVSVWSLASCDTFVQIIQKY